ncbi:hypothetical protein LOZ53_003129 [Ophidiomyces ophidiicola]|nr:hypothetical protein LOZ55_004260 [Ophidiomyces ophidiicola]KAI1990669.1 hypothetical protein LOZ53_003129 [Ophidiomyces ophidiicola]KAI1999257.1 hypothetical protein LOZ51_001743 [Ophidiomyces ophidiicola]
MRAKRSKKYRKLMHQYEVTFGFREPYQVLVDSHFLRALYSFKMDLIPSLERTLQGKVKPFLTKCSLAAMTASFSSSTSSSVQRPGAAPRRPPQLPPPTVLPLRYCSHNEDDTPIDEASCLLSLLSPSAESKKNKEHYILASADPTPAPTNDRKRAPTKPPPRYNLRRDARSIPGVPIIYVKRSVMILEPMSGTSEGTRDGIERGKFKNGLISTATKRKREDDEATGAEPKEKKSKKVKGVNPLSVKKPKKRENPAGQKEKTELNAEEQRPNETNETDAVQDGDASAKTRRKRRHKQKPHSEAEANPDGSIAVEI